MVNPSKDEQSAGEERLHDLIAEYHDRVDQGETLDPAGFTADHPELESELSRYFENVATLESLAGPTASQSEADPNATVIAGETHDGGFAETMIEGSQSGNAARISKDAPLTQFGRYRIRKELGRGAMGAVYLAHDEQLDREVALKIPKFETDENEDLLERFYREARAAAALQHPGICPVHDVGELDGQHYITMAYVKGRPLRDFTKSSKRQKGKQVARVIRKIAMAMAEAHEHNVVHRDLKPANIMINERNEPVVMDFGLARRSAEGEEQLTHTGTVIGTPAYMSPEQVDGDNEHVGPHSDIYSLGVIFYEMLTGQLPFQGNLMSILKQIALTEPKPPLEIHDDIDSSLQDICLSMMAKKSEDRPASMSDVARDLTQWLQGRQVVADESEPLETSRVPGQQASCTDEPTAPIGQTGMPDMNVKPEATFTRTTPRTAGVPPKNKKLPIAAGLGGAVLLLAGIVFFVRLGKVNVQITVDDPSLALKVDGDEIVIDGNEAPIRLSAGTHELIVKQGNLEFEAKEFKVTKDGKNAIHVVVLDEKVHLLLNGATPPGSSFPSARSNAVAAVAHPRPVDSKIGQQSLQTLTAAEILTSPDWEWTEPVNLGPEINSPTKDACPSVTRDGLTMVFASSRDSSNQTHDIFISTRKSTDSQWSPAINIKMINTAGTESEPAISPDGRTLVFYSMHRDREGNSDLWVSRRETSNAAWSEGKSLGPNVNSPEADHAPQFSDDGLSVTFSSTRNGPNRKFVIRRSSLDSTVWSPPEVVTQEEMPINGGRLFASGRVALFRSSLTGPKASNPVLLQQIRRSKDEAWGPSEPIAIPGNESTTDKDEQYDTPHISYDGRTIWFAAKRPGGHGNKDIWMSRRRRKSTKSSSLGLTTDTDRSVAEWVLILGGTITTDAGEFTELDQLPRQSFQLTEINLESNEQVVNNDLMRLTGLENLTKLSLGLTAVNDTGLVHLKKLTNLTSLALGFTKVSDTGLVHLKELTNLVCLRLIHTRVSDTGLEQLKGLINLTELTLSGTRITDAGLLHLRGLPNLKSLSLGRTEISDMGIRHLKQLTELSYLQLEGTQIGDAGLKHLSELHPNRLRHLNLISTQVSDAGLAYLKSIAHLTVLELRDTNVSNSGVEYFKEMPNLRTLKVNGTKITASGVGHLQKALPNCRIEWDGPDAEAPPPAVAPFDAAQAKVHQEAWAKYHGEPVVTTNSVGMKLAVIPPGEFKMGEDDGVVAVTLTKPFRAGVHEVTQTQWKAVMGTEPWKGKENVQDGARVAVTWVTWKDAMEFCQILTERERAAGKIPQQGTYRLPTDAEWEYTCRGGTTTKYSFGDDESQLSDYAWYELNAKDEGETYAHEVGLKKPNPWGLFDTHGNVFEWCADWRNYTLPGGIDPTGPAEGSVKVTRGGGWGNAADTCRVTYRGMGDPVTNRFFHLGFRVVLTVDTAKSSLRKLTTDPAQPPPAVAPFDAEQARSHQEAWSKHLGVPVETTNTIGMKLIVIPPGEFMMGKEDMVVRTKVPRPFHFGIHEVTQSQYTEIMKNGFWKHGDWVGKTGNNVAASFVSWLDATEFCLKLTEQERKAGAITENQEYRLPTEAEWEFACRAGTAADYSFGADASLLGDYAWYEGNVKRGPGADTPETGLTSHAQETGLKKPNPFGLFDVHGNVAECCSELLRGNTSPEGPDPESLSRGIVRFRGGTWQGVPKESRSSGHIDVAEKHRRGTLGFRVLLTLPDTATVSSVE